MKNAKLITGILNIVFTLFIIFQSCAAGFVNIMENNGEVSGTAGVLVALLMLAGGIVEIATRNSNSKGSSIAVIVMFSLAALLGYSNAGSFGDLNIWASWCLAIAVMYIVFLVRSKNTPNMH